VKHPTALMSAGFTAQDQISWLNPVTIVGELITRPRART